MTGVRLDLGVLLQVWSEGNQYKLFGCNNYDRGPMQYFLYDLLADPNEMHDLSAQLPAKAAQMKAALQVWIASVVRSTGPAETNCAATPPPTPPAPPTPPRHGPFTPVLGQNCTWEADSTMPGRCVSTRILGRRAAPFPPLLISYRVPRGFTQDPSTDRENI